jgi:hypothetical protein
MSDTKHLPAPKSYFPHRNLIANLQLSSLLLGFAGLMAGCGGASQIANLASPPANSSPAISLSPGSATVGSQEQLQFTARLSGTADTAVTWSASAGTISSSGLFTAPAVSGNTPVAITATSVAKAAYVVPKPAYITANMPISGGGPTVSNPASRGVATVTVVPLASLAIATTALPSAATSMPYSATLSATGGAGSYQWSLAGGSLPPGILLLANGTVSGQTALAGSYSFTPKVTDASGHSVSLAFLLIVSSVSASGFDGPAELPRIYIPTAMSNTPAPGVTTTVNAGANLQSALNSANCGDTLLLQAGATFSGAFTFPAKNCDDNHWIIVRTSSDDSLLPAEGSRLTPCYAGVSSLPGRPAFNCTSTNNVVAKLVLPSGNNGPVIFASGANYYRLTGLEITRLAGTGLVYALSSISADGSANNIILDRVWLHGTAQDETNRGVDLGTTTYFSIVDSFLTDFHCISVTGSCGDAQAINGGLGSSPMGPYKIVDNFLEASGENILFGGGAATVTPADIQISQNHMFKPFTWMKGQPGYVGGANGNPFIVKNLFELKNAQRVLLDSNIMEDSWGGFSQVGFAILLTPKNPYVGNLPTCTICQVTDVTIRYDSISHVAGGFQIANALAGAVGSALDGQRYSIHDVVIDDINGTKYDGPGLFAQISVTAGAPLLQNVTINHVTAFPPSMQFMVGDTVATSSAMKNFVFTNSIVNAGVYPVWSTGGGTTNCAHADQPLATFNACFSPYSFASDAVIGSSSSYPPSLWPPGNFFPATASAVQFVNYNGGIGGDYRLQSSSPYKGAGTDGQDLGADIDALNSAIAGVE